jgi:DNA-binding MarR family transcriptional regulator
MLSPGWRLGGRLLVTKQAAAKTVAMLQECGYVARDPDPNDGRGNVFR